MTVTLPQILLICCAGGVGSLARVGVGAVIARRWHAIWGTLAVNVSGSFLIGGALGLLLTRGYDFSTGAQDFVFLLATAGFLGGYTTVSGFAVQVLTLLQDQRPRHALALAFGAILSCPLAALVGVTVVRGLH